MVAAAAGPAGRGAFIVFEGVDRSGKSTQSERLVAALTASGVDAEFWRFPDRTLASGKVIDAYLRGQAEQDDAAVHLLFAANRWEKRQPLLRKLAAGTTLIVDRYAFSGAVFTAAKGVPGLDLDWCKAPDRGLPAPDAVFFLDLAVEEAARRGGFGGERYERTDMQLEVRRLYGELGQQVAGWQAFDAAQTPDALAQELSAAAEAVVRRCAEGAPPLKGLWTGGKPLPPQLPT